MADRQDNRNRGGNRGGNPPPQQGGGNAPQPQREPDWTALYSDLATAADGVMEFPDRIVNMTSPKNQLIAALAWVERMLGITGSPVTNANAEERVGIVVYRLATWEEPVEEPEEEDHGGGQVARPAPPRPRGPQGGAPAHPTHPAGGPATPSGKSWWRKNVVDPFWTGKSK